MYCSDHYTAAEIKDIKEVQESVLGPVSAMTEDKATRQSDGSYHGGIAYECSPEANFVKNTPRSYSLGPTFQDRPQIQGPPVGAKLYGRGDQMAHGKMRFNLLRVRYLCVSLGFNTNLAYRLARNTE